MQGNSTRYPVRDSDGSLVATHHRIDTSDGKKVWWESQDGTKGLNEIKLNQLPLYGAHQVSEWPEDDLVILVEGEKARDAVDAAGLPAVGTVTGAGGTPGK